MPPVGDKRRDLREGCEIGGFRRTCVLDDVNLRLGGGEGAVDAKCFRMSSYDERDMSRSP